MSLLRLKQLANKYIYIAVLLLSSFLAFAKGYLYSFLFEESAYADFNYYLLIMGLGALLAPLGLTLRCHSELPKLIELKDDAGIKSLIAETKFITTIVFLGAIAVSLIAFSGLISLAILQAYLFSLFFIDQILVKSRLKMMKFAVRNMTRNTAVFLGGLSGYWLFQDVVLVVLFEVVISFIGCLISSSFAFYWVRGLFARLLLEYRLFLVVLGGILLSFGERAVAALLLNKEDFSLFAFFFIIVMLSSTLQQFINTRFIVEASSHIKKSYLMIAALKRSGIVVMMSLGVSTIGIVFLMFNGDYYEKSDLPMVFMVILLAAIKSSDFFQAALLARKLESLVLKSQLVYLIVFLLSMPVIWKVGLTIHSLLSVFIVCSLIYVVTMSKFVYQVSKGAGDDISY